MKTISILDYKPILLDEKDEYSRWGDYVEVEKTDIDPASDIEIRQLFMEQIKEVIKALNKKRKKKVDIIALEFFTQQSRKKNITEYWWVFWGK